MVQIVMKILAGTSDLSFIQSERIFCRIYKLLLIGGSEKDHCICPIHLTLDSDSFVNRGITCVYV